MATTRSRKTSSSKKGKRRTTSKKESKKKKKVSTKATSSRTKSRKKTTTSRAKTTRTRTRAPKPPKVPQVVEGVEVPPLPAQQSGLDPVGFYVRLQKEEERLRRLLRGLNEVTRVRDAHDLGEAESDHGDIPMDSAAEVMERTRAYLMEEQMEETLERIQDALDKLQEGTYGICDNCGEPIGEGRLRVVPYATFCIQCQSKFE